MKQEYLQKIFGMTKILDDKFQILYKDENIVDCNKIELMAELMELLNSSMVFKYWKNKPMDYEDTLYEYADGLSMLLFFFNIHDVEIRLVEVDKDIDTIALILELIDDYNRFINHDEKILNEILSKYIFLGEIFGLDEDDILRATLDKIKKTMLYLEGEENNSK